jgi:hypothetical protein
LKALNCPYTFYNPISNVGLGKIHGIVLRRARFRNTYIKSRNVTFKEQIGTYPYW